ncbi:YciI family protein [Amycolatopsis saalfeldensis]|uniref:Uncharacterized conserved protein n=1 Tax=Amycolatopsis saalfeldensis TaxID=394193 RepID=A0A1H8YMB9_9PSEU|nr:YciI family protein [Amycolatopsis saalfeldensis]SEP53141.1 Uncharacterized conserved protein [Amycolatopsis saalfeldensis]
MAKYLFLIYGDEQAWEAETEQDRVDKQAGHGAFTAAAGTAIAGGHELLLAATATSLRGTGGGRPTVTDGPFLESKEVLGGYYVVEAPDLDAATALAAQLPELAAAHGGVEIRPIRTAD